MGCGEQQFFTSRVSSGARITINRDGVRRGRAFQPALFVLPFNITSLPQWSKQNRNLSVPIFALAFGPLGCLSRFLQAELPALFGARVALQEAFDFELGAQFRLVFSECAGNAVAQGLGLA